MHEVRPFIRQYFLDDNDFVNRIAIDWILNVANGKTWYFSFDKFDSSWELHKGEYSMIHSSTPLNADETAPSYPLIWEKRAIPFQMSSYIYRSAMSLWAIGFEATAAMAAWCADARAPFNTGEWWFSVHHIPRVSFSSEKKFFKHVKLSWPEKLMHRLIPWVRLKNRFLDFSLASKVEKGTEDLYLYSEKDSVFYTIDWTAPLEDFPKPWELDDEYGHVIFQIGSGLYWLRKHTKDWSIEFNWDRFQKIASFCRAFEIKLAQWAKQSWGILKAIKNTPTVAEIRGVEPWHDIISPNRFPFYEKGKEKEFFEFMQKISEKSGWKPIWCKIVISDASNIEPLAKQIAATPEIAPDFITIDGWDGWSGAAPIYLSTLFWKRIFAALETADEILKKHKVRNNIKIFAAAKLYTPYMSAKALAHWADAIWNARSIMISAGCIRAAKCSWEHWACPVGIATMKKSNRRGFRQAWDKKVEQVSNFINAHNAWLIQVAAISWLKGPQDFEKKHIAE
jgi:glutamate synthase domain-containing protein 2